jgi:hypothetical protein
MKRGLKVERRRKKVKNLEKKTSNFFLFMRFYLERRNVTDKKGLFYAKFFEFEEFFHPSFFLGSIQPQHAVQPIQPISTQIGLDWLCYLAGKS